MLSGLQTVSAEPITTLDFIYVNANTGQSSGGHSALRLGNLVYHFQFFPDKIFHIIREPWENFRYVYGIQENRTIRIMPIVLNNKNYNFFLERLNDIYLKQQKELKNLEKLDNDFKILESVVKGDSLFHLKGAGYFSKSEKKKGHFKKLKSRINSKYGSQYLLKSIISIRRVLNNFNFPDSKIQNVNLNSRDYPRGVQSYSSEYIELLSRLQAFEVLYEEINLNKEALITYHSESKSEKKEILLNNLNQIKNKLEDEILFFLSDADTTGYPLLIKLAKYLTITQSIEEEKLIFLNTFGKSHSLLVGEAIQNKVYLSSIYKEINKRLKHLYENLFQKDLSFATSEIQWTQLEDLISRREEIVNSLNSNQAIRVYFEIMLPAKEENVYLYHNKIENESLERLLAIYRENRDNYEKAMQAKYPFNLLNRNCTTEIFRTLNSFLETKENSTDTLGGYISEKDSFVFIPVYAYNTVEGKYNTKTGLEVPSFREIILSKKDFMNKLKETNTITSNHYKFNNEDSLFLFFTDDLIWTRPLFGIVNLVVGTGELMIGTLYLPMDNGDKFIKGLQGIFFSLPELIFFNIRKGTFIYETNPILEIEDSKKNAIPIFPN